MIKNTVSVIIPAYNAERTIVRALESVRLQSRFDYILEILIINDGSIDNTVNIISHYINMNSQMPIRLINKKNGGVSSARNQGLREATGEWIALLDSDDEWLPDKLEKQFFIINTNNNIDFLGGNHTDETLKILGKKINRLYKPTINELCIKVFPQTSTVIFRRSILNRIGYYDENRKYGEDAQFFYKICEKYNYFYMPDKLIVFDGGKRGFGVAGLSSNLKEMNKGELLNFKELYNRKSINILFYIWIVLFCKLKYIRRIVICKRDKYEKNISICK